LWILLRTKRARKLREILDRKAGGGGIVAPKYFLDTTFNVAILTVYGIDHMTIFMYKGLTAATY
jgi:hypothetical protein